MMASLLDLPDELLLRITEYFPFHALKSFSVANSRCRKFLEPSLFKTIKATNREEDRATITTVIQKYGRHVEQLSFELHLTPDDGRHVYDNKPAESQHKTPPPTHKMTDLGRSLLSGKVLPNIAKLSLTFLALDNFAGPDDDWGDDQQLGCIYIHEPPERQDEVAKQEASLIWRATINHAYQALAMRSELKALELRKVVPRACSTFYKQEWRSFLSGLKRFNFELWGTDNGAGWHSNTTSGYNEFIGNLEVFFFAHLTSVKRVKIAGDVQNPIEWWRIGPNPQKLDHMPMLEHLKFENYFIDPAAAWLKDDHPHMKSLILTNCFSNAHMPSSWAEFFRRVRERLPTLTTLIIMNDRAALTQAEEFYRDEEAFEPIEDEPDNIRTIRTRLADNPELRVWSYVYLDDKYGMVFEDEERNVEAFEAGEDQSAFEELMEVLEENRRRSG